MNQSRTWIKMLLGGLLLLVVAMLLWWLFGTCGPHQLEPDEQVSTLSVKFKPFSMMEG